MDRDPLTAPPADDTEVAAWTAALGLDGLIDLHVHFQPVVVHCGHGPGATGLDVFGEVLAAHTRLVAVLGHAGLPDYDGALELALRYPRVHLDHDGRGPLHRGDRSAAAPGPIGRRGRPDRARHRLPNDYATQLRAIAGWAAAGDRLGAAFVREVLHDTPARLLQLNQ